MNTSEAIKILREAGYSVEEAEGGGYYIISPCDPDPYSEVNDSTYLIKRAKEARSRWYGRSCGKNLKHYDHRKDRRASKQKIGREEFDDLSTNQRVKRENPWNWD